MATGYFCPDCGDICDENHCKYKDGGEGKRFTEKDFDELLDAEGMCLECWKKESQMYCDGNCDDCDDRLPGGDCSRHII